MSKSQHRTQAPMVSLVAVVVAVVAEAMVVASRRPDQQRRRKPKHVQTELHRCGLVKFQLWQPGRWPNMLQPRLQPPLQDKEVEQEDKAALAKDSKYAK